MVKLVEDAIQAEDDTAGLGDVPEVADVPRETPTVAEAQAMFTENPGLASVVTTEGRLSRDGILD